MLIAHNLMSACHAAVAEREELLATVAMLKAEVVQLRAEIDHAMVERLTGVTVTTWADVLAGVGVVAEHAP